MKPNIMDLIKKQLHKVLPVKLDYILRNLSFSNRRSKRTNFILRSIHLCLIFIVGFIVYMTGGASSYIHLMYIPIMLSVFLFGIPFGLICALFAGFMVGPFLPLDIKAGIKQETFTWILRLIMFIVIVVFNGLLLNFIKRNNDHENQKNSIDIITGYPNFNKLKKDLNERNFETSQLSLPIIMFELENLETINRYVDHNTGQQTFINLLHMAKEYFKSNLIYSISPNRFIIIHPSITTADAYNQTILFLKETKKPIYINGIPVAAVVRCGAHNFSLHTIELVDMMEKLEKALDQAHKFHNDIMVYSKKLAKDSKIYYETLVSIYQGIQNNTFSLVYQPKIRIKDKEIAGVEVLLRWNNNSYKDVPISDVIKIAEDAEFISQITKWVIKHSVLQLKLWQDQGLYINIAINLSSKDLMNDSILKYTKECMKQYKIDPTYLEFELTERSIIEDEKRVFSILEELKNMGIKVSLDDYGTGHNSLIYLTKPLFTFHYLKMDKLLIDLIENETTKILLSGIISAAHGLGMEVIAEGVEYENQLHILESIGCDMVQGYYYSKPLSPTELKTFIQNRF